MAEPAPAGPAPAGFDIRRILLLSAVVLVILFAVLFFFFRGCAPTTRGNKGYTVIYSNLALKDAANVIARLKEMAIPYEIRENGKAIAVPKEKADQARLGLAEENLPAGGVVGWEIFDESKLGATDFDRRIQLIRAISGELSRTIRRIEAVEDARVQIVLPETRLFAETVIPVTASVMLRLKPGAELSAAKINGIVHLVASSVENLQTENVTVIDDTGRILTAEEILKTPRLVKKNVPSVKVEPTPEGTKIISKVTPEVVAKRPKSLTPEERILLLVQAKKGLEMDLTSKAQEILNRFYPPNSAIVKVNVDLKKSTKPKIFSKTELIIRKISTIILIDNRVEFTKNLKQSTYKAVAAAIGYNKKRGDRIILQKVPFHLATPPPAVIKEQVDLVLPEPKEDVKKPAGLPLGWLIKILWLILAIGLIVVIVFLVKLIRKRFKPVKLETGASPEVKNPPASIESEKKPDLGNIKNAVERNPEQIAKMLKTWLTE